MRIIDIRRDDETPEERAPSAEELAAQEKRERIKRAMQSLSDTLSDIVGAVEDKRGERCPYRNAQDECTHIGGCQNKQYRAKPAAPLCGGDQKLKWDN